MNSYNDCIILQNDISSLNRWCIINKMRFHPDKCKVLSVSYKKVPWIDILLFAKFSYELQNSILDYVDNERDLGVLIHDTLNWELHHNKITSKARNIYICIYICICMHIYIEERETTWCNRQQLFQPLDRFHHHNYHWLYMYMCIYIYVCFVYMI